MCFFDKIIEEGKHYLLSQADFFNPSGEIYPYLIDHFNCLDKGTREHYLHKRSHYTALLRSLDDILAQFIFNRMAYPMTDYRHSEAVNIIVQRVLPADLIEIARKYPILAEGVAFDNKDGFYPILANPQIHIDNFSSNQKPKYITLNDIEYSRNLPKTWFIACNIRFFLNNYDLLKQRFVQLGDIEIDLGGIQADIKKCEAFAFIKWQAKQLTKNTADEKTVSPFPLTLQYKKSQYPTLKLSQYSMSDISNIMNECSTYEHIIKQGKLYLLGRFFFIDHLDRPAENMHGFFDPPPEFAAAIIAHRYRHLSTIEGVVEQILFEHITNREYFLTDIIGLNCECISELVNHLSQAQLDNIARQLPLLLKRSNQVFYNNDYSDMNILKSNLIELLFKFDPVHQDIWRVNTDLTINLSKLRKTIKGSNAYACVMWTQKRDDADVRVHDQRFNDPFPLPPIPQEVTLFKLLKGQQNEDKK